MSGQWRVVWLATSCKRWHDVEHNHKQMGASMIRGARLRCISAAMLLLLSVASTGWGQVVPEELRAAIGKIDSITAAELAKDNIGSVTVGVVSAGNLVWTKSYG